MGRARRVRPLASRLSHVCVAAFVLLVVAPAVAHAWTPGTHVYLGEAVMRSLALLPVAVAELLREFPNLHAVRIKLNAIRFRPFGR